MRYPSFAVGLLFWMAVSIPVQATEFPPQQDMTPVVSEAWSIESVLVHGGDFFTGYRAQTVDFKKQRIDAYWDKKDPRLVRAEKSIVIDESSQNSIKEQLWRLEPSSSLEGIGCGIASDGPESYADIKFRNEAGEEKTITIVPGENFIFTCGDRYVTRASFVELVEHLEMLLPPPEGFGPSHI